MIQSASASASGKINLFFAVGPLQDDGFHSVASVYQSLNLRELVTVSAATNWQVNVAGEISDEQLASVPTGEDNLVVKAAKLVAKLAGLPEAATPLEIDIFKCVPVAGGMGGGSADAAAAMVAANEFWQTGLSDAQMQAAAVELGADVPFALMGGNAIGVGKGEDLTQLSTGTVLNWVLVLDDGGLSTPTVYRRLDELRQGQGQDPTLVAAAEVSEDFLTTLATGTPAEIAPLLRNDLQLAALDLMPHLANTIDAGIAAGALAGMVSGSGPTVALLAESEYAAEDIANRLAFAGYSTVTAAGPAIGAILESN